MSEELQDSRMDNFVMRLKYEAERTLSNNKQKGCAIITVHVLMDAGGVPLAWVVPDGKRIEPSKDALDVIRQLAEGL
jgi:hypothetical protein